MPDTVTSAPTLSFFIERGLISFDEAELVGEMFEPGFPFADALSIAKSVHVQVKVKDLDQLPHDDIVAQGVVAQRIVPGFRKYSFPGGLAVIFTSGPISEEDLIPGAVIHALPFVDHFGIDLRQDTERSREIYAQIADCATRAGWRHARQGGPGSPVRGCYSEVAEKRWVFPSDGPKGPHRPIEFAFGELEIFGQDVGCDYRPIDPAHPLASLAPSKDGRADQSCGC